MFDREAAKKAGYTDQEIDEYLANKRTPIENTQQVYDPFSAKGNPVLENVLQGVTFGFSDELQAGAKTLFDKATGAPGSFSDVYRQNVTDVRQPYTDYNRENPGKSLGLNVAGGFMTGAGLAKLGGAVPKIANFAKLHPLMTASTGGAAAGAVSGLGYSDTLEDSPEAIKSGMLTGGLLPVGLNVGGKVLSPLIKKPASYMKEKLGGLFDTPQNRAVKAVTKDLQRDGLNINDIYKRADELGPESLLVDVGGVNTRGLAQTIASSKGRGAEQAEKILQGRMMGSPDRLVNRMRGILKGDKSAYRYMKDTIDKRKQSASPLYKKAFEDDYMVNPELIGGLVDELKTKIDDFEGTSIGNSLKGVLRSLGSTKDKTFTPKLELKKLHAAKIDLDTKISNSMTPQGRGTTLTTELMGIKRKLLNVMDDSSANYKNARKIFSDDSSVLSAIEQGKKILRIDAEEMSDVLMGMSDAEKKGFITGAMQTITNTLKGTKEGANSARKIATPLLKERIRNAFDSEDAYNNFVKGLDAEDVFAEVRNNVLRGSQTQQRLNMAGQSAADVGADVAQGRILSAALDAVRNFFGSQPQIPESVRDEISDLLFSEIASGKISKKLMSRLRRYDINERMIQKMMDTISVGVPVVSGEIGAQQEQ